MAEAAIAGKQYSTIGVAADVSKRSIWSAFSSIASVAVRAL